MSYRYLLLLLCSVCCILNAGPTLITDPDEAPDFKGAKLVFVSVASHNAKEPSKEWSTYKGHLQSFPHYLEKLITEHQDLLPQMRLILIDPCWNPKEISCTGEPGYEKSYLKRYLDTLPDDLGKKIEKQLYLVGTKFAYKGRFGNEISPDWLEDKLSAIARDGGIVLLTNAERKFAQNFPNLYQALWDTAGQTNANIQYSEPNYTGDRVIWFGSAPYNAVFLGMEYKRGFSISRAIKENGSLQDVEKMLEKSLQSNLDEYKERGKGNPCKALRTEMKFAYFAGEGENIQRALLALCEHEKVLDISTGKLVSLTMEQYLEMPLPYLLVTNDPDEKNLPLLEYDLGVNKQGNWKLIHKLNWRDDVWFKHIEQGQKEALKKLKTETNEQ